MQLLLKNRSLLLGGALLAGLVLLLGLEMGCGKKEVDFNTQIRPILNSKCLSCHGGVKRKGDLSLLYREEALKAGESGRAAIVPGKPDASELMHRITHHDPEERMPRKKEPLTAAEVELFRNWIKEGAQWETHWAYQPPKKYRLPAAGLPPGPPMASTISYWPGSTRPACSPPRLLKDTSSSAA